MDEVRRRGKLEILDICAYDSYKCCCGLSLMLLLLERVRGRKNYHKLSQTVEHTVKSNVNRYPHTQIRFQWTSCRGTMHQTLITDRGHPKNRYPYNLNVRVSCAKPVGFSIVSLQS